MELTGRSGNQAEKKPSTGKAPMQKTLLSLFLLLFASTVKNPAVRPGQVAQVTHPGQGCTVIYASAGDLAFGGNNEDSHSPLTRAWFIPASKGDYGRVYFGYDDLMVQGGVNDQGLFFDGLYVPPAALDASAQNPEFPGGPAVMVDEIMARSATVDQALAYFLRYNRTGLEAGQLFFGDKAGNSAIVEENAIVRKKGAYQIATNFRQSEDPGPPYFDGRYNTADELLSQAGSLSVERMRQVLEATHQEDYAQTVYSQVYDLKQGLIYLYFFHDYQNGMVLNLAEELAKGPHMLDLAALFPENQAYAQWLQSITDNWKTFYEYRIDRSVKPARLGSLAGAYRLEGETAALPIRVYLEKDQLYLQMPNELPLELYPDSNGFVFHPYYNNTELRLTFQRNLPGQVTGAQAQVVYDGNKIAYSYSLNKAGVLSDSRLAWLAGSIVLLIILISLVLVMRKRRA
jgi:hypothetical protein